MCISKCFSLNPNNGFGYLHCGNGGEFRAEFERKLVQNRIDVSRSRPYTPEENGKCEIQWKTIDIMITNREDLKKDYRKYAMAIHMYNAAHVHASLQKYKPMQTPQQVLRGFPMWKVGEPLSLVIRYDLMDDGNK